MASTNTILRYTLIASFLVSMFMAFKLWTGINRIIPEVPLLDSAILSNARIQFILIGTLVFSLLLSFSQKLARFIIPISLAAFTLLVLSDVNRLQSYYYQYLAMLLVLALMYKRSSGTQAAVLYVILAGVYFHSGLTKWNDNFVHYVFPNMLYAFSYVSLETWQQFSFKAIAYSIPLGEMIVGLLLLVPRTRKIALYLIVMLHIGILFTIGPLGLNWNPIVWVWNISMIAINILLYFMQLEEPVGYKAIVRIPAFGLIILLFGILPFLNQIDKWDNYLSFSLYSGTTPNVQLHLENARELNDVPLFYLEQDTFIDLNVWALQDISTAIYAEEWVFEEVAQELCAEINCTEIVSFEVYKESIRYVE